MNTITNSNMHKLANLIHVCEPANKDFGLSHVWITFDELGIHSLATNRYLVMSTSVEQVFGDAGTYLLSHEAAKFVFSQKRSDFEIEFDVEGATLSCGSTSIRLASAFDQHLKRAKQLREYFAEWKPSEGSPSVMLNVRELAILNKVEKNTYWQFESAAEKYPGKPAPIRVSTTNYVGLLQPGLPR